MTSIPLGQALRNLREKYQFTEEETPLDRVLDATADWIEADRAVKVAGLWLAIGTGAFTVVAVVWMAHQIRTIGGF